MPKVKPSEVVRTYRAGAEAANRIGMEYSLDERRLESLGLTSEQIDAIYKEIDRQAEVDRVTWTHLARLDATFD